MSEDNKWTITSSHVHLFIVTLQTGETTDLCLAQELVGQLDLGVVQNIKVLTGLGQGDIKLLL